MYPPHVDRILAQLAPSDIVLDIGGWACPFNRATHVMDDMPYETRGFYRTFGGLPFQGPATETFTPDTWIRRDICEHTPYPFADKSVDFVICSHTLEDIRDPLWVCAEMVRIAKRGYLEVPSRLYETCRGVSDPHLAGTNHHRWLVEVLGNHVAFTPKFQMIHASPRRSFPASFGKRLPESRKVTWLFWDDRFTWEERRPHPAEQEMEDYVAQFRPEGTLARQWHAATDRVGTFVRRVRGGLARRVVPDPEPFPEAWIDARLEARRLAHE